MDEEMKFLCKIVEAVGILKFAHRIASELSGSEWRRVMIAQALVQEPGVLLLDEPTLHLDIENHDRMSKTRSKTTLNELNGIDFVLL